MITWLKRVCFQFGCPHTSITCTPTGGYCNTCLKWLKQYRGFIVIEKD